MTDKATFVDTLQYGQCSGTPYRLSKCFWGNAGAKFEACPDKRFDESCNCCSRCRKECARANAIKKINRRKREDDLEAIRLYFDEVDNG